MNNSNNKQYWCYVFQWKINANDCEARPHTPSSLSSPRSRITQRSVWGAKARRAALGVECSPRYAIKGWVTPSSYLMKT